MNEVGKRGRGRADTRRVREGGGVGGGLDLNDGVRELHALQHDGGLLIT